MYRHKKPRVVPNTKSVRNNTSYPRIVDNMLKGIDVSEPHILQYHQRIVKEYFVNTPDTRGLLIFHSTGTGKTLSAIAVAEELSKHMRVIILSAKSLQANFVKDLAKYEKLKASSPVDDPSTSAPLKTTDRSQYQYISSNAGNMMEQFGRIGKTTEAAAFERKLGNVTASNNIENSLIIVDEAQNLLNGIVNGSKNATLFYEMIMRTKNVKLLFLSATPIINDPFEIVPLYNMLDGRMVLPDNYTDFYETYITANRAGIKNREKLKNRIFGLTSYMGDWWKTAGIHSPNEIIKRENFPDQLPTIVERVEMSEMQYAAYINARSFEISQETASRGGPQKIVAMQKPQSSASSTYRVESRQVSNYVLPDNVKFKRPSGYGYIKNLTLLSMTDILDIKNHSPKMERIYKNMQKHKGLGVVYSNFVSGEGLKIFSMYLEARGYVKFPARGNKVYCQISGDVDVDFRTRILKTFNKSNNRDGEYINLMLLSGAGSEGLDLRNVNHIHIMEPYWNYGKIMQIIARAIRYLSHKDYPDGGRVQPYIYLSDYPAAVIKRVEKTTDVHLYEKSVKAKYLIDKFYGVMIEASIDCNVHRRAASDTVKSQIKCVMCAPTNTQLFKLDYRDDNNPDNPCKADEQSKVTAEEIEIHGNRYYYTVDKSQNLNVYTIYEFDKSLNAHVPISRDHPHYSTIYDAISDFSP